MNIIIGIISLIITFSFVVLIEKIFKKEGIYAWIGVATIMANIAACKSADFFGFTTNLGNVLFASLFLSTDIMCEKYGTKESKKAVLMGVFIQIVFITTSQITLLYIPSTIDLVNNSMKELFSVNLRVSISSIVMYFVSNMLDIDIFERLKRKYPDKLWLRNNISTIISNCLENYLFSFFAFYGLFSMKEIILISTVSSVLEIIIALLDTPFLYLSKSKYLDNICKIVEPKDR